MKKLGFLIYLATNLYLIFLYGVNIREYYLNKYNYDGIRYLIPIVISDILFFISLLFLFYSLNNRKVFYYLLGLSIFHNINMGLGIENIPFIGIITGILTIYIIIRFLKNKPDSSDMSQKR